MSVEAARQLEKARQEVLASLPCVKCGVPAGDHSTEELRQHLDEDRQESRAVTTLYRVVVVHPEGVEGCAYFGTDLSQAQDIFELASHLERRIDTSPISWTVHATGSGAIQ